jgi:hypothetical protein
MPSQSIIVGISMLIAACGGEVISSTAGDGGAFAVDGGDAGTKQGPRCSGGGARLCGAACGDASPCPGSGCTMPLDVSGAAAAYGICWSDLQDDGTTPCALCDQGQGCVRRGADQYVCVPLDACAALLSQGATGVCWYGDKVPYDGRSEATTSSCPSGAGGLLCGGDCAPCDANTLPRCVGRGADHPIGICPPLYSPQPPDPNSYPLCALGADGYVIACPNVGTSFTCACAISPSPPGDSTVALANGFCMSADLCTEIAGAISLDCYDATGAKLPP